MLKLFWGICVCGLLCRATSPAIAGDDGDDIWNRRANQLRPMTVTGIPPGDVMIAIVFAVVVAAVAMFIGGGVGNHNIVVLLGESWV